MFSPAPSTKTLHPPFPNGLGCFPLPPLSVEEAHPEHPRATNNEEKWVSSRVVVEEDG